MCHSAYLTDVYNQLRNPEILDNLVAAPESNYQISRSGLKCPTWYSDHIWLIL